MRTMLIILSVIPTVVNCLLFRSIPLSKSPMQLGDLKAREEYFDVILKSNKNQTFAQKMEDRKKWAKKHNVECAGSGTNSVDMIVSEPAIASAERFNENLMRIVVAGELQRCYFFCVSSADKLYKDEIWSLLDEKTAKEPSKDKVVVE
ncbi:unnamed protein product [Heligmosomoides polygyrus]|uniref:DUF1311 domain-containing protein n=1 Tax=Heligmosomoides polygyrus TaxID=6339 RepID=A0A3P8DH15_HELPZ|nr:unnamed protein product [Heligmosomoides polygyrus]